MLNAIVPLTGDPSSERGLEVAQSLAARISMSVELLNVIDTRTAVHETYATRRCAAEAYLAAVGLTFPTGVNVNVHVRAGNPAREIANLADELPSPLVILAPRWSGDSDSFVHDGVTEELLQEIRVPVMLVPATFEKGAGEIENIVIPVSGRPPHAEDILAISQLFHGREMLFRVVGVDAGDDSTDYIHGAAVHGRPSGHELNDAYHAGLTLMTLCDAMRNHGLRTSWELRHGDPVYEIVRAAETTGASVVAFVQSDAEHADAAQEARTALSVSYDARSPVLYVPREVSTGVMIRHVA